MEYPIKCPKCKCDMIWQSDFSCYDKSECECEEGIVSYHYCSECEDLYTYTFNCSNEPDNLSECEGNEDE